MKKAKPILSAVLALVMILALAACGGTTESAAPESTAPESAAPESAAPGSESPDGELSAWAPEQQVELVVPFSAGGASDLLARAVEAVWSEHCDQPLVVTNMPGGGGVTGAMYVASAEPDGYTLVLGYGSGHDMSMGYLQELDYDPSVLEPVCLLSVHSVGIVVPVDSEFNSMADVKAWSEANPDTPVTAAVSTANGTVDLTMQAIRYYTGINMSIVPHDGGSSAVTDLLSGSFMIGGGHPSEVGPYVESGQLKILGIASEERDSSLPDVPTLKEQGIDFACEGSIKGIAVPVDTPDEIVAYYEELFRQITEDPDFQASMVDLLQPVMYLNAEDFTQYYTDVCAESKQMIEDLGLAYYQQ